jgi:hypothetical protein
MIALLADPAAARRMGELARRRVHDTYEVGAMVRAYEGVYSRLLNAAPAAAGYGVTARAGATPAAPRRD